MHVISRAFRLFFDEKFSRNSTGKMPKIPKKI